MNGAWMIPNSFLPESAPGERVIFERFKSDPACNGWIVLHSLDLARHVKQVSGEADFVVIVPNHGVAVFEVKSHEFVKLDERGWWLGSSSTGVCFVFGNTNSQTRTPPACPRVSAVPD